MKKFDLKKEFIQSKHMPLGDILKEIKFQNIIEEASVNWQETTYPPLVTLQAFIKQTLDADQSCRKAVAGICADRVINGELPTSVNTGPYCKARKRLCEDMIKTLAFKAGNELENRVSYELKWKGRDVKLIDGTTLSMPDSDANQAEYPQSTSQIKGLGFPITRCVAAISLATGGMLGLAMGAYAGKQTGEHALLREILDLFSKGDVVLGDRYYCSYFLIAELQARGVDLAFELNASRKSDFRKGKSLGKKDHLLEWDRSRRPEWMTLEEYQKLPKKITLRESYVNGKVIVSTFADPKKVSKKDIKKLYGERWSIEVDFFAIKETMQMGVLRCKTPSMVRKEIYVHIMAYNLIRIVMAQAAKASNKRLRSISFKGTMQILSSFRSAILSACGDKLKNIYTQMLLLIANEVVGNRPGRAEPRAIKRRPKGYSKLTKPRGDY